MPFTCAVCGSRTDDEAHVRLSWSRGVEAGREVWTCEECSRHHVRSIEGKLDPEWW